MDPVVHFELPADDLARAQAFYRKTFGWGTSTPPGGGYTFVTTTEVDPKTHTPRKAGNVNGGMLRRQAPVASPVVVIQVADLTKALRDVEANGGKALGQPRDVGPGLAAYFKDSEGNVVGLFQPKAPA